MGLNMTSFDAGLKVHYNEQRMNRLTLSDHPLLALMPKMTSFGGKNHPIPIIYGNPQSRHLTFSSAQTAASSKNTSMEDFVLTRVKDYAVATIDGETMDASMTSGNAFVQAATTEIDGAFEAISQSLASALYRDGTGALALNGGAGTSKVCTLANSADIVHFEVGMDIDFVDVTTYSSNVALKTASNSDITAVDRDAGTFTLGNLATSINDAGDFNFTLATTDYVAISGDVVLSGTAMTLTKVAGLEAWIPSSAPGSTAFFGVNRSVDTVRLGGVRYDGSSEPIEEALINGAVRVARDGGRVSHYFVSMERFADVEKALGSKKEYDNAVVTPEIGFQALKVWGPKGPIKIIADQNCQSNIAWGLDLRRWKLYSLGSAPRLLNRDGNRVLRESSSDGVEARIGYYAQLGCQAPGHNVRLVLPTT